MSGTAYAAIGSLLWVGDGSSPETFFKVAKVQDIAGPKVKTDTIDVTTHDTDDGYKEFIASLKDGQEVTFPCVFDPNEASQNESATIPGTQAGGLKYLLEQRVKRNMRLVMPTSPSTRFAFVGLVVGFEADMKVSGALMAAVTIKVSKKPLLEQGVGA